jgi:hypothetical protein
MAQPQPILLSSRKPRCERGHADLARRVGSVSTNRSRSCMARLSTENSAP